MCTQDIILYRCRHIKQGERHPCEERQAEPDNVCTWETIKRRCLPQQCRRCTTKMVKNRADSGWSYTTNEGESKAPGRTWQFANSNKSTNRVSATRRSRERTARPQTSLLTSPGRILSITTRRIDKSSKPTTTMLTMINMPSNNLNLQSQKSSAVSQNTRTTQIIRKIVALQQEMVRVLGFLSSITGCLESSEKDNFLFLFFFFFFFLKQTRTLNHFQKKLQLTPRS